VPVLELDDIQHILLTGTPAIIDRYEFLSFDTDIVLIDSTHFTTLFGGTDSLQNLWHNLATMRS
jgi:hypothetical protein